MVTHRVFVMTFLVVLVLAALAQAQTFTTLHTFTGGSDGGWPNAGVIQDSAGNLYGTTWGGGDSSCNAPYGCGVVYEVNTAGAETVLHTFTGPDGGDPVGPLLRDSKGNIFGTTWHGGSPGGWWGTVFKIDTAGKETVLYSFTGGSDGCFPHQGLVVDRFGNLYGTTWGCGALGYGTIFKVDRARKFTVLHGFTGYDGWRPQFGHLTMDRSGNLYGVASGGGPYGCYGYPTTCGVLYELSKKGKLTVLYSFSGGRSDGCYPDGSLVQDKAGNFYGTASECGSNNLGTIWKVNKKGKETILYDFAGPPSDCCGPWAGVTWDSKGNLYGDTYGGGANGYGTVYKLSASGRLTVLHDFDGSDGASPISEVVRTTAGVLYGTTSGWGSSTAGTVWSYVP